jgi:hypothetical protein
MTMHRSMLLAIDPAFAQERIVGIASVIDGDTIEIHGQRIRLMETGELIWRRRIGSRIFGCVDLTTRYYLGDNMSGQSRRAALGWALLKSS